MCLHVGIRWNITNKMPVKLSLFPFFYFDSRSSLNFACESQFSIDIPNGVAIKRKISRVDLEVSENSTEYFSQIGRKIVVNYFPSRKYRTKSPL
jgi:hypothetical protein